MKNFEQDDPGLALIRQVHTAYCAAFAGADAGVAIRVLIDEEKFADLAVTKKSVIGGFSGALNWFADNWPDGAVWPDAVARPAAIRERADFGPKGSAMSEPADDWYFGRFSGLARTAPAAALELGSHGASPPSLPRKGAAVSPAGGETRRAPGAAADEEEAFLAFADCPGRLKQGLRGEALDACSMILDEASRLLLSMVTRAGEPFESVLSRAVAALARQERLPDILTNLSAHNLSARRADA